MSTMAKFLRVIALVICATVVAAAHAAGNQRSYASPEEAAAALVKAVQARDRMGILTILGADAEKWLWSGDAAADRAAGEGFIRAYEQKHAIAPQGDARATLTLGSDDWPFAFPLVSAGGRWRFDTEAGKEELLARRIGTNELDVINVMMAIVDAQREYASADRDGTGLRQYARKFASNPGKTDGLYWPTTGDQTPSPLGALVMNASRAGYTKGDRQRPYHGYYFRMLTRQGPGAKGGAMDYIVKGRMIGGFAVLAYPAQYGNSGIMTFIVNHDGVVYEKDLGANTAALAGSITSFDPASVWSAATLK